MSRHRTLVTYLVATLVAVATAIRYLVRVRGDPLFGWVAGLLAVYFCLLALEPWLSRRSFLCTHLYLAAQTGIVVALALLFPLLDYFASLFIPLVLQDLFKMHGEPQGHTRLDQDPLLPVLVSVLPDQQIVMPCLDLLKGAGDLSRMVFIQIDPGPIG